MMKVYFQGNILLVSLMILSGTVVFLFMAKDTLLGQQRVTQNYQYQYLMGKLPLVEDIKKDEQQLCTQFKKAVVKFSMYSFSCYRNAFFIRKPTKSYVESQHIEQHLAIEQYQSDIYTIKHLSELPHSSLTEPKIVKVVNPIDEALNSDFYGIIITEHYFDIKGKYKLYGIVYSSYNNKRKERNLTYKKEVVDNIDQQFVKWDYLPHSKSVLPNAD